MSFERSLLFETCELGVSSAVAPELLPDNQFAWGMNIDVRGGKAATRPNLRNMGNLPPGLIQGCEFFGVQGGMLVASISGVLYRLRIGNQSIVIEEIPLTFRNSGLVKQVWMTQTIETLVIQDGQSDAILYNGSTAPRAGPTQVPRGRQMAYGNGRLWVAVDTNNALAGDIRTGTAGSELYFTEATYLSGGGKLFFNSAITGMAFIPVTGQSDYGALMVYGARETNAIRADITSRDDWGKIPGFVTAILRSVGAASQWSLVAVNQDLYWRDSNGGLRSIRNALADEAGPGSAPISREVSRLTDYDSEQLLGFCSGVYFENRMLTTSSPYLMKNGGIGWKNLISLDFAPLSTMGGKTQPAYNGKWNGLNFVKLVGGQFSGKNRAFALTTDDSGNNQLWEFDSGARADLAIDCTDGTAIFENPISSFVEYPLRNFGDSKRRKRLARCDVWLTAVNGEVDLKVYWRSDNSVKWLLWDEATTCAKTSDPATTTPHAWKNLIAQERPQFKTFTIPDDVNDVIKYSAQVGFEFQIRLAWVGRARIHRVMLHADLLDDPDYANRDGFEAQCIQDDITGNQIDYVIPTDGCPPFIVRYGSRRILSGTVFSMGNGGNTPVARVFTLCNDGPRDLTGITVTIFALCPGRYVLTVPPPFTIPVGECGTFTVTFHPEVSCPDDTGGIIDVNSNGSPIFSFTADDADGEAPAITVQPVDTCIAPDGSTSFFLTAAHGPLEYDWFVSDDAGSTWTEIADGDPYSGANTSTLTINPAAVELNNYMYRCRVRNPNGSVTSDEVTLTVGLCSTNLILPILANVSHVYYADLATAQNVMNNQVADCLSYLSTALAVSPVINSWSALHSNPFVLHQNLSLSSAPGGCYFDIWNCITAQVGPIQIDLNAPFDPPPGSPVNYTAELYDPTTGTLLDSDTVSSSGFPPSLILDLPASGNYLIRVYSPGAADSTTANLDCTITSFDTGAGFTNNAPQAWYNCGSSPCMLDC